MKAEFNIRQIEIDIMAMENQLKSNEIDSLQLKLDIEIHEDSLVEQRQKLDEIEKNQKN